MAIPTMTEKIDVRARVALAEKERWEEAARQEKRSLASFVRIACEERAARIIPAEAPQAV